MPDLISPPIAIENAAPIKGRNAQLEAFSVSPRLKRRAVPAAGLARR